MATAATYQVRIAGQTADDDGYSADLGKTPPRGMYDGNRRLPACPDCGGMLIPAPAGKAPCDASCVGQATGKTESGVLLFDREAGCGSTFTIDPNDDGRVMMSRRRYYY